MRELAKAIQEDSELCVRCGLCLAHCPTYDFYRNENESPRGRIALLHAVASEHLPLTPALRRHIDRCLNCGRCEEVCPSKVPYTRLLSHGREYFEQLQPRRSHNLVKNVRFVWEMCPVFFERIKIALKTTFFRKKSW